MIKNHFNTSLQRQRRRQRNEQADKVAKMPGSGSSATSVSHEALERAASNATTRLEDVMNSVRSAATEISDDKLLSSTSSMSKSSSSASSASCLGPVEASNRGMPSTAAESGMFPAPSLPDTISQSPATKHSEHRPPTPSSTKSSIPASITTPAPAMRLTRSDHKMGYHPYARISQASPRRFQPNPRSNTEGDLHVEPVRPRNQHLTPPTTPETESHLSYQRAGTGSAVAAPISAPSSLQHFDVAPITPTRRYVDRSKVFCNVCPSYVPQLNQPVAHCRLTLAGSASSSTSRGISTRYPSSLEMFPVTSTTQAMQSMVFGSKTSTLPPDPGSSGPLPLSEQDEHHSPPLTVQAPRAMHLSSLLSSSLENSPVLGLGLSAPQPYPFTARNVVDSSPTAYAQRGQHTFASAGNQSNPYPHQQPHPSQWGYGTSSHGTMYYNSRHDSITSSGELVSAGLRSPMSTFQSPQSYGGGFPSTSSSVGSYYYNTALTSPASSATYSTTYARKYSTSESPSAFASGLPHAPDQYAFFQTEPPQPFTQGSGSYHEILPVEGSREGRSRVQNGSGMDQSPSDVFSAAASGQGFNAGYSWVSGPSGSLSNQPIREEQEEYSQRESQPDAVKERHLAQRSSITGL